LFGASPLKQLSRSQVADEAAVGGEEIVAGQVFEACPTDLLEDAVLDFAAELMDREKLQVDGAAVTVVVANAGDRWADDGVDPKFFVEFAGQGLFRTFAGLDFSAWKLPLQGHRLVGAALPYQNFAPAQNQRGGNEAQGWTGRPGAGIELRFIHRSSVNASKRDRK
jgi:hypothetical protein